MNLTQFLLILLISLPIVITAWIFQLRREQHDIIREVKVTNAKVLNIGIQFNFRANIFVVRYEDSANIERVGTCIVQQSRVCWLSGDPN